MSMIEMKDVVKKYDNGTTALRGVSIHIEPGEFAYIVGPSGAGKSTFIRLLYREIKIDKGNLAVAGFNLGKIKKRDIPMLRRRVGVVFQDYKLLPKKTVYEKLLASVVEISRNASWKFWIWLALSTRFVPSRMSYQGENSSGLRLRVPLSTILRS